MPLGSQDGYDLGTDIQAEKNEILEVENDDNVDDEIQDAEVVGHFSDYKYYMTSVGGRNFLLFVAFVTLHVFSGSFSSMAFSLKFRINANCF